ncbi:hypothetical protein GUITHDRAFT_149542, partial [Guillardia theta CCMP2712]
MHVAQALALLLLCSTLLVIAIVLVLLVTFPSVCTIQLHSPTSHGPSQVAAQPPCSNVQELVLDVQLAIQQHQAAWLLMACHAERARSRCSSDVEHLPCQADAAALKKTMDSKVEVDVH